MDAAALSNLIAYTAQTLCLAALATVAHAAMRVHAPAVSYAYWRIVLAGCVVLPWLHLRPESVGAPVVVADGVVTSSIASPIALDLAAAPVAGVAWPQIIFGVLAAGTILRVVWLTVCFARLRTLRHAGRPAGPGESHEDLQRLLGTAAHVRFVPDLAMPVTFGVLRPVVLLPSAIVDRPEAIHRAIAAHELLHVQRRDWLWHLLEEGVRAVFWFNPAVWWIVSRIDLAREAVVDETAVLVTGRRRAYLDALLTFADDRSALPAAAFARRRHLFLRIQSLSRETVMSSKRVVLSSAVLALVVVSGSFGAASAFPLIVDPDAQASLQMKPGPIEQGATSVSTDNPLPKRTQYEAPEYPAEARMIGLSGSVRVILTLDEFGRVAEARSSGVSFKSTNPAISGSFDSLSVAKLEELAGRSVGAEEAKTVMSAVQALSGSAHRAVHQWRYEPPVKSPLSFEVTLFFKQDGETSAATHNGRVVRPSQQGTAGGVRMQSASGQAPVRVGGNIAAPQKVHHVPPQYPAEAQANRITGMVIIEAVVGTDGVVETARVLRSVPLLDQAALDAVTQWRFTPTLLNGNPVPVIMTVTVNFTLQ